MIEFTIITTDDWQGVYLNGGLVTQGHTISAFQLLRNIDGYKFDGRVSFEYKRADAKWLESYGYLPDLLINVKLV